MRLTFVKNYKPKIKFKQLQNQYKFLSTPLKIGSRAKIYNLHNDSTKICKKIYIGEYAYREIYGIQKTTNVISPKLHEIYEKDKNYYIIMDKYQSNLLDYITNPYQQLSFKQLLYITNLIIGNITTLHDNCKVLHQDIKPFNIVINDKQKKYNDKDHMNFSIKLIDFDCCSDIECLLQDTLYPIGTKYYKYEKTEEKLEKSVKLKNNLNLIKQDYFALGITLSVLFTNGKYHESLFYNNKNNENKKILYESILNNHHEEIFYGKLFDTDDILSLVDVILWLLDFENNEKINLYNVSNNINLFLKKINPN